MRITGKCHCGNISYELEWPGEPSAIQARACNCSFCVKHGGVWTSNPKAALGVAIRDPSRITQYRFGTKTADFHVCANCGVVPLVTSTIDGRRYAVINVNTFENVEPSLLHRASASFEDEETESRLARRKRYWIADVRFNPSST